MDGLFQIEEAMCRGLLLLEASIREALKEPAVGFNGAYRYCHRFSLYRPLAAVLTEVKE